MSRGGTRMFSSHMRMNEGATSRQPEPVSAGNLFPENYSIKIKFFEKEVFQKKFCRYFLPRCCCFCNLPNFGYQESWKFAIIYNSKYKLCEIFIFGKFQARTSWGFKICWWGNISDTHRQTGVWSSGESCWVFENTENLSFKTLF